jgi:hypothetical protein
MWKKNNDKTWTAVISYGRWTMTTIKSSERVAAAASVDALFSAMGEAPGEAELPVTQPETPIGEQNKGPVGLAVLRRAGLKREDIEDEIRAWREACRCP